MKTNTAGAWNSPVTAEMAAGSSKRYSQIQVYDHKLYWLEQRPEEGGRSVVVCQENKQCADVTPKEVDVRTSVHEYGGGEYTVGKTGVYYVDRQDQCIYRIADQKVQRITKIPEVEASVRYADLTLTPDGKYLLCVCERHEQDRVINELLVFYVADLALVKVVSKISGADFYMFPCVSPDGKKVAWVQWDLPQMPWDGTTLWCADFINGKIKNAELISGGKTESIYQPCFSPNNELTFVSDKTGWWNVYQGKKNLAPMQAECAYPAWVFGTNTYAFVSENTIAAIVTKQGVQTLGMITNKVFTPIETPYDCFDPTITVEGNVIYFSGGNATEPLALRWLDLSTRRCSWQSEKEENPLQTYLSTPVSITFDTADNQKAYAFYYPPKNPKQALLKDERPPLLVLSHGGPTSSTSTALDYKIQFWTSRGFAVIDVNYRGSTGYGRAYRNLLLKNWGKVDVEDCIFAARYCIDHQLCDAKKIFIRGKSASGLTALLCLEKSDLFAAAAIYYGVADMRSLLDDTHKFESRYPDSLVGVYPEAEAVFLERSPLNHIDKLNSPVIFFQGLLDKVVVPAQTEKMIAGLKAKHIRYEYVQFKDEGHGFRKAENVKKALMEELAFYQSVLLIPSAR